MVKFQDIPALAAYLDGADHVDVKTGRGTCSLREFVVGVLSYEPVWMRALWNIRVWLLKALGQNEHGVPGKMSMTAETLPIDAGQKAGFFTVADSDGETFWVAIGEERHLGAAIGVVTEPSDGKTGEKLFHLVTVVQYRSWVGPVYFNIIRPFHHLVVYAAMRDALQSRS